MKFMKEQMYVCTFPMERIVQPKAFDIPVMVYMLGSGGNSNEIGQSILLKQKTILYPYCNYKRFVGCYI